MNFLKALYPASFKLKKKETKPFVTTVVIFAVIFWIVIPFICGLVGGLIAGLTEITFIGTICTLIGSLFGLYGTGGIACAILKFVGVFTDEAAEEAAPEAVVEAVEEKAEETTEE